MVQTRRTLIAQLGTAFASSAITLGAEPHRSKAAEKNAVEKIRIGQIGVGHGHASKISVYRNSADYEVVGIVENDPTAREAARSNKAFQDVPWMTQEQLLNVPGLQAVLVETEVRESLDVAHACIDAGKHIHLDKPAGDSLPRFQELIRKAEASRLMIQMGYMYRYNPAVVLLREFLKQGYLGDVFEIHAVMSKVLPAADRIEQAKYRGGMMFELGCHLIDLILGTMGAPDRVHPFSQSTSAFGDTLNDNMLAVLTYPRAIATVKSSAVEVEGFSRRHLVVCGTEGTFHIQPLDNPTATISLSKVRGNYRAGIQEVQFPKYLRYVDDAADMASILRDEKESDYTYAHDLHVQQTVLQASGL